MLAHYHTQHTLAQSFQCEGIGLHSGVMVRMCLKPAAEDTGIVFVRTDIDEGVGAKAKVPAVYHAVTDTRMNTTIENAYGTRVSTVEHLIAALWGLGVDNAVIEIDAEEVPVMDGSSEPFIALIEVAGVALQDAPRRFIKIDKEFTVRDGDSEVTVSPYDGLVLDVSIDFADEVVAQQRAVYDFDQATFKQMLSRARTFCFEQEVDYLKSVGLARGGSLDNAVVIGKDGVLNEHGLRFDDEFVRHKALDCCGDFFLAGMRIEGHIRTHKPGHGMNNKMLKALFSRKDAWHVETFSDEDDEIELAPSAYASSSMGTAALAGAVMSPNKG